MKKIFLVECEAEVYDNDLNLIIEAETEKIAKLIAQKRLKPAFVKNYVVTQLVGEVLHEYSPNAGDPNLGD